MCWAACVCRRSPLQGMLTIPAADLVSPIFTLWLTLLLMYAVNCVVDYLAAVTLKAAYTADMRRGVLHAVRLCRRCCACWHHGQLLPANSAAELLHTTVTPLLLPLDSRLSCAALTLHCLHCLQSWPAGSAAAGATSGGAAPTTRTMLG
jgi:hypothetical protein